MAETFTRWDVTEHLRTRKTHAYIWKRARRKTLATAA